MRPPSSEAKTGTIMGKKLSTAADSSTSRDSVRSGTQIAGTDILPIFLAR